jgi:glycosyltransferase involved in cell wall biosynthesis
MRVGVFAAHTSAAPNGHGMYQEALIRGLLGQTHHQIVVLISERDLAPPVEPPHELIRVPHPRQPFVAAVNFDVHAEGIARIAAERAGLDALIANGQFHMPRPRRVPRIVVLYEAAFMEPTPWGIYSAYSYRQLLTLPRRNLAGARAVVCLAEHGREQISRWFNTPRDRIRLAPPSFQPFGEWNAPHPMQGRPYVMEVGWFHPRKDVTLALAAWREAVERGLDADLVLVGTEGPPDRRHGSMGRRVLETVGAGLASRVRFTGSIPRPELGEYYRGASAVLMTSIHEGFGIPAIEAASVGVPVVAVGRASLPEVVGPIGTVVAPDPVALGEALLHACTTAPDVAKLTRYAASFNLDRQVAPFLELADRIEASVA